jgi:large subunit ribosomal protein L9
MRVGASRFWFVVLSLFLHAGCLPTAVLAKRANTSGGSWSFTTATFIPPAHPPSTSCRAEVLPLAARKKAATASPASKKIQVKLLKYVAGTGQAGDVVLVTPPFFNNKLRPTKLAELISDEQVQQERAATAAMLRELEATATVLKKALEEDGPLVLRRKAGPDGRLFGGIGPKLLMEEFKKATSPSEKDFFDSKGVKVTALMDEDGKKIRGDIKHTGSFQASLSLTKNIMASVNIEVQAEA